VIEHNYWFEAIGLIGACLTTFSFLPQAAYPEHFEQLFGTPTGLDFRLVVQMYGGQFRRIATWQEFRQAVEPRLSPMRQREVGEV